MSVVARWAVCTVGVLMLGGREVVRPGHIEIIAHGRRVWSAPIDAGEAFDVSFIHSQERTRWTQHYVAGADRAIWQRGSTFASYGAGMPLGLGHRTPDGFTVARPQRLASIPMLHARAAGLALRYRGQTWAIDRWCQDYEPFEIRVR